MTILPKQGYQGYAGYGTPEAIARKRRLAEQLLAGNARTPRNVGEGLGAIGRALGARGQMRRADEAESAGREAWQGRFGDILGGAPGADVAADTVAALGLDAQPNQGGGASREKIMAALADPFAPKGFQAIAPALLEEPKARSGVLGQYDQALNDGFKGTLLDYQRELASARRPVTNVSNTTVNRAEGAFSKKIAEGQAELFNDLAASGVNAQGELAQITEMENLIASGVGGTGDAWRSWAQNTLGISISGGAVEAFDAMVNKLVPQQRPPGSGQMSDRDVQLFKQSLPQLVNSPEGNALILETMRGMAEFKRAQGEISRRVMVDDMSREEGINALYALPDPLEKFRKARKSTLESKSSDELRDSLKSGGQ